MNCYYEVINTSFYLSWALRFIDCYFHAAVEVCFKFVVSIFICEGLLEN